MAVTKLWPVSRNLSHVIDYAMNPDKTAKAKYSPQDYQALKDVISYAKNEEKTEHEFFCQGINCDPATARDEFVIIKRQFGKTDGIQAYHGYLSFKEQDITPEFAQKVGMEFAQKVWGEKFQVVVTTHLNTQHLHCHFVINSVSFVDGKRCQDTSWFKFRHIADNLCKAYKLNIIENPQRNPDSQYLTKKEQSGMPTRYSVAREALDEAISMSTSQKQLEYELKNMGYTFNFNEKHKYWTIRIKGYEKPIRLNRLGDEYTKEKIIERLISNRNNLNFQPFHPKTINSHSYSLLSRERMYLKRSGLYGLYRFYVYRLSPCHHSKPHNNARVHYLLKDDLMKLDKLTAQTTLLGRNHIGSAQQLFIYKNSVEDKIKILTSERTHLRNEIRKVGLTDEKLLDTKDKIFKITDTLRELRKEVKLCDDIAERSNLIRERIYTVIAEEEKTYRKENRNYEYKR